MKKISLILLVGLCVITGCGKKEEKKEVGLKINEYVSVPTTADSFISNDNKLIVNVSNNSSEIIDLYDIDVAFYNESGELLKTGEAFLKNILANKKGYVSLELPKDEKGNIIESTKIDIKVHENKYETKTTDNYIDKIKVTYTKDEKDQNKINLKITNSSNKKLDELEVVTLLKENNIVVATLSTYLMNVDKEATSTVYIPAVTKENETKYITYDAIESHINHAIKNK